MLPHSTRRMISTGPLALTRAGVQVRNMAFISAASRVAARAGGRAIGFGALGVGGAAYVGSQVDEFRSNLVGSVASAYDQTSQAIGELTVSAVKTLGHISNGASTTFTNVSASVESGFDDLSAGFRDFFGPHGQARESQEGPRDEQDGPEPSPHKTGPVALSAIALASAADDQSAHTFDQSSSGLMHLTRKLIEIRSLLMSIDKDESLVLPSIVVIGSQSSGKSSVLEAIVGHEFLPKGNNMVTRRPLELTLVHTPPTAANPNRTDYVECAQFGPGQFDDFRDVQRRLTRLNLDVPDSIAVDESPIHLKVYSAHVPDLSLVDLPGYVQLSALDQPEELREKIGQLCDKYIRKPNIILAVCAADVDLANSPALRAAKRVDPHGYRTIGVVTKLDLVDPSVGAAILSNDKYRLALGYVGVVCRAPAGSPGGSFVENRLLKRAPPGAAARELARAEQDFFRTHGEHYSQPEMLLGTETLKHRLMRVLEDSMASSLHDISNRVSLELEEASYQYKVQYNDRAISPESYVAETMDLVKRRLAEFSRLLVKAEVRGMLRRELEQRVLGLLAEIYWTDRRLGELAKLGDAKARPEGAEHYWVQRLEAAQSRLTKGGIGRTSAELVAASIRLAVARLAAQEPLVCHPSTGAELLAITDDILDGLRARAADHVEIGVMPYRYEVEVAPAEWEAGRAGAVRLMEEEVGLCEQFVRAERAELRKNWRLREAVEHVREDEERLRKRAQLRLAMDGGIKVVDESEEVEETRPPPVLLDRARRLRDMETRISILRLRATALRSRRCKAGVESKSFCPEAFLNVVADRLASTSTDFINIDLLSRFFSIVPHELNSRLIKKLEGDEAEQFARENPEVRKHLEIQDRKEKLEKVMRELITLAYLEQANGGVEEAKTGSKTLSSLMGAGRGSSGGVGRRSSVTGGSGNGYFSGFF